MGFKKYKIKFNDNCIIQTKEIYEYISQNLYAEVAAKRLMAKIRNTVMSLSDYPRLYAKIDKVDKLKRPFRKIVINNYIILYTIDDNKKIIYISDMYYGKRNYLERY